MKKCFRCKKTLPADHFSKNRRNRDGLQSDCKSCVKGNSKRYSPDQSQTEKKCSRCDLIQSVENYRIDRTKRDGYTSACKRCMGVKRGRHRRTLPTLTLTLTPTTKQCGDCMLELPHASFHKTVTAKGGLAHVCKECAKKKIKAWARSNPDKKRYNRQSYRARSRSAVSPPINDFSEVALFFGNKCMHPGCEVTEKLTLDHVTPLIHGGMHCNTNFQILCRSHNSSKGARVADYRDGRILVAVIR